MRTKYHPPMAVTVKAPSSPEPATPEVDFPFGRCQLGGVAREHRCKGPAAFIVTYENGQERKVCTKSYVLSTRPGDLTRSIDVLPQLGTDLTVFMDWDPEGVGLITRAWEALLPLPTATLEPVNG